MNDMNPDTKETLYAGELRETIRQLQFDKSTLQSELAQCQRDCAAMRTVIENIKASCDPSDKGWHGIADALNHIKAIIPDAIATDAGLGYVSLADVQPLVEALEHCVHANETDFIDPDSWRIWTETARLPIEAFRKAHGK